MTFKKFQLILPFKRIWRVQAWAAAGVTTSISTGNGSLFLTNKNVCPEKHSLKNVESEKLTENKVKQARAVRKLFIFVPPKNKHCF